MLAKLSMLSLAVAVGLQVALPAKAFYATSSVIADGQSVVSKGRGFLTDIVIPYVLPLALAVGVIIWVYGKVKRVGKLK